MIRNIVFDYGGVLVDWNPRYLYDPYFGDAERSRWFIDNICTGEWNAALDGGKPFDVGVAELTAQYPEWADAIAVYREMSTGCTCPKTFPVCVCGHKKEIELVGSKPLVAGEEERRENPRSTSAKLRIVRKVE